MDVRPVVVVLAARELNIIRTDAVISGVHLRQHRRGLSRRNDRLCLPLSRPDPPQRIVPSLIIKSHGDLRLACLIAGVQVDPSVGRDGQPVPVDIPCAQAPFGAQRLGQRDRRGGGRKLFDACPSSTSGKHS